MKIHTYLEMFYHQSKKCSTKKVSRQIRKLVKLKMHQWGIGIAMLCVKPHLPSQIPYELQFKSCLLCFPSSPLLMHLEDAPKGLSTCHTGRSPRQSARLLASASLGSSFWDHFAEWSSRYKIQFSLSSPPFCSLPIPLFLSLPFLLSNFSSSVTTF